MRAKVDITRSTRPDKRMKANFPNQTVHFGQKKGSTFLEHQDSQTKSNWMKRHAVREDWNKYNSAGALSKHLLWNKPTLEASIKDLNARQKKYEFVLKL